LLGFHTPGSSSTLSVRPASASPNSASSFPSSHMLIFRFATSAPKLVASSNFLRSPCQSCLAYSLLSY
jgi:hypothetical protein